MHTYLRIVKGLVFAPTQTSTLRSSTWKIVVLSFVIAAEGRPKTTSCFCYSSLISFFYVSCLCHCLFTRALVHGFIDSKQPLAVVSLAASIHEDTIGEGHIE
ncbi:hypothetical protein HZ326_0854 [Fusarium oxysporum f. sp. albedinis]|nr:hypothetical protein HZ326_0854 [Fusarium oxysporum f. sp. albedinis]